MGGLDYPTGIAVDDRAVYWASWSLNWTQTGTIMKVGLDGGSAVTIATLQAQPMSVAVNDSDVFWLTGSYEWNAKKLSRDGGTPIILATSQPNGTTGMGIALDARNLYWVSNYGSADSDIYAVPIDGGARISVWDVGGSRQAAYVAVDATHVYWTEYTSGDAVRRVPLDGGAPQRLALGLGAGGIAVDATHVYWAENHRLAGSGIFVRRVPKGGGVVQTLYADSGTTAVESPQPLVIDDTYVYWVFPGASDGAIMKVPKDGGAAVTLAAPTWFPYGLAINKTHVYWTTFRATNSGAGGTVERVPK